MLGRAGAEVSDTIKALLQAAFFEAHKAEQRILTRAHLDAAAERVGQQDAVGELVALVEQDRLPLMRLIESEPLQMQGFHLSFQEFYAMRAGVVRPCCRPAAPRLPAPT